LILTGGKRMYSDINLSHCPCVYHRYSVDCVRIKPRSSERERANGGAFGRRTALQAGSSQCGVFGIFHCLNPSGSTMALGSTHPLTNEYQEYYVEGKGGRCVGLSTFMCRLSGNLEASSFWNLQGLPRPVQDCFNFFTFTMKSRR
jgi:hypothetical protein